MGRSNETPPTLQPVLFGWLNIGWSSVLATRGGYVRQDGIGSTGSAATTCVFNWHPIARWRSWRQSGSPGGTRPVIRCWRARSLLDSVDRRPSYTSFKSLWFCVIHSYVVCMFCPQDTNVSECRPVVVSNLTFRHVTCPMCLLLWFDCLSCVFFLLSADPFWPRRLRDLCGQSMHYGQCGQCLYRPPLLIPGFFLFYRFLLSNHPLPSSRTQEVRSHIRLQDKKRNRHFFLFPDY